ncbi:MAG: glutamate racemase [Oscillospiraceae bacterium]|nr:glutamate racemase [Oscillospiraceae bacterium]
MDKRPIGVFDSGLGGLTAVRELKRILPGEDIVYFGDTGRIPYGTRSRDTILRYARQDISFLQSKDVKYLMAACGTVSSTYPAEEAAHLPIPYTGVITAAVEGAIKATRTGRIGVIGTAATIRSGSYVRLLRQKLPPAQITARPCPLFVPLVENGFADNHGRVAETVAREYLADIMAAKVDTLILGCTHYPLLKEVLQQVMGPDVALIDPGAEAAHAARKALFAAGLESGREEGGTAHYYVSDDPEGFSHSARLFLGDYAGGTVEQVRVETY